MGLVEVIVGNNKLKKFDRLTRDYSRSEDFCRATLFNQDRLSPDLHTQITRELIEFSFRQKIYELLVNSLSSNHITIFSYLRPNQTKIPTAVTIETIDPKTGHALFYPSTDIQLPYELVDTLYPGYNFATGGVRPLTGQHILEAMLNSNQLRLKHGARSSVNFDDISQG